MLYLDNVGCSEDIVLGDFFINLACINFKLQSCSTKNLNTVFSYGNLKISVYQA